MDKHWVTGWVGAILVVGLWGVGCQSREESGAPLGRGGQDLDPTIQTASPASPDEEAIAAAAKEIASYPTLTDDNAVVFLQDWWREHKSNPRLSLQTDSGEVVIELFDDTPVHSGNLHYKAARNYYNPSEFVRIVPEFVVQGGNSEDPLAQERRWLIGKHTLPAEFAEGLFHHRGAVAMGRTYDGNPTKRSASYDFYIVVGRKVSAQELFKLEQEKGFTYSDQARQRYLDVGGAPHLDREHTVFGRVVEGMAVVDALASVPTDASDWPLRRLAFRMLLAEETESEANERDVSL